MSACWFVTWGTYGVWLPGDPRGFRTWRGRAYVPPPRRYAQHGEIPYNPAEFRDLHEQSSLAIDSSVTLMQRQREIVRQAIVEDLRTIEVVPAILSVGGQHVHLIARFGVRLIRPTVGRLKAAATRALSQTSIDAKRVWAKGCHMESLTTPLAFRNAFEYVRDHEAQGAVLQVWDEFVYAI